MSVCLSVVCSQVEVFASGRSLVQRSATDFGMSEFDRKTSVMRRHWPTRVCCAMEKLLLTMLLYL
jgi:hypothetical protein